MYNIIENITSFLFTNYKIIAILIGYLILLSTSGKVVLYTLSKIEHEKQSKQTTIDGVKDKNTVKYKIASKNELDTGFIIGKCENILILTFVLLGAYTALALIFGAKTIIRQEEIKNNSLFYLAGTMINLTYSIVIGILLKSILMI
jgi:hypothetical protein